MPPTPRPHGPKKKKPTVPLPSSRSRMPAVRGRSLPVPLLAGAAGLVVLIVGLGIFVLRGGGGSGGDAPALLKAAGCSFQTVQSLKAGDHSVLTPQGTSAKWNTAPPTNGPHYQVPAIWGSYTDPLFPAQVVHNLEHGGIFIQYGPGVPTSTVAQLQAFYNDHQNGTLLAPLPSLGTKIALGAWVTANASTPDVGVAHLAKCAHFDEKAFAAFFDNYQFQGPERFPASTLTPGS